MSTAAERAEKRRERVTVTKVPLDHVETDASVQGLEAIRLTTLLVKNVWAMSGKPIVQLDRADLPIVMRPR